VVPSVCQLAQHVREIGQRCDAMLRARAHETVERGRATRRVMRAGE
jgi:hypothetical protein